MNVSQLVDFICAKVRKQDSDSKAACRQFIQQRDMMLYDNHLWRHSVHEGTVAIDPVNNTLHAAGVVLLPKIVGRVLAVRTSNLQVRPENLESFFQQSPDAFAMSGTPVEHAILSPVVYQSPTAVDVDLAGTSETAGGIVRYVDSNGDQLTHTIAADAETISNVLQIDGVERVVGSNQLVLSVGGSPILTLAAATTRAEPQHRVRLVPSPTVADTLRFLVKRKYQKLTHDSEEPRLLQAENCLIAYVKGDMYERSRQMGKASSSYQEGAGLLSRLEGIEFYQQSNNSRLIPDVEVYGVENELHTVGKAYF